MLGFEPDKVEKMNSETTPPTRVEASPPTRVGGYLEPGSELGGYRIIEVLGTGGMGQVFRAVDAEGIEVAMKVLHPHLSRDEEARERLRREVSALHRVRGRRVARVLDAEADGLEAFVVTELLNGLTLDQSVREEGVFEGDELVQLAEELSEALNAIHAADVIHRDLKPSNVMLTEEGAKVIDFGIAQVGDESRITKTGLVVGTAGYLAPEVFSGAPPTTEHIDWYAWAAVLLYAATGKQPFGTGPFQAVLARMERGEPQVAGLPVGVAAGLRAGLHPDPAQRAHPGAVLRQLQSPEVELEEITQIEPVAEQAGPAQTMVAVPYQPTQIELGHDAPPAQVLDPNAHIFAPDPHPAPHHPPAPPAAKGVLAALAFLFTAAGVWVSVFALALAGGALWLSRTAGIARVGQFRRRMRRGQAGAGGLVLRLPWYLIRALGGIVWPLLLSLFTFALVLGVAWIAIFMTAQAGAGGNLDEVRRYVTSGAGGLGVFIGVIVMWRWDSTAITGRTGMPLDYDGATRVGTRVLINAIARNRAARGVLSLVIVLIGLIVLTLAVSHSTWFDIFEFASISIPGA